MDLYDLGRELDTDVLDLCIARQGLQAFFASVPTLLVPAEWKLDAAARAVRIDVDLAGLDAGGKGHRLVDVSRPDAGDQSVLTAVLDFGRLLDVVQEIEGDVRTLLMIGHNPGFAELAHLLTGHGDRYAAARMGQKFPTCGLAVLDFAVDDWRDVTERGGRLDRFVTPASLGEGPDE